MLTVATAPPYSEIALKHECCHFCVLIVWHPLLHHLLIKYNHSLSTHLKEVGLNENVHGGSVTIASNNSPHLQGFWVTSNVHRSIIRDVTSYCAAETRIPDVSPTSSKL